jgi:TonB family protein
MSHPLTHGIDTFFHERTAARRRVAGILLVLSVVLGSLLAGLGRRVAQSNLLDVKRFGFEGPEQRVDRIHLEEQAPQESPGIFGVPYLATAAKKGGRTVVKPTQHPNAPPAVTKPLGLGESEEDLLARARMLSLQSPVVRSEDLVVEKLVRPDYPPEARDKNLEGVVEMIALVDTSGSVVQVQIVGGTREPLFESAAARAILECKFRPYRVQDQAQQVWAAYRIAFSLY